MKVCAVGIADTTALQLSSDDRHRCVEDRHGQKDHGNRQGESRRRLDRCVDGESAHGKADRHAAGVTEKNLCRWPVVDQESQNAGAEQHRHVGNGRRTMHRRQNGNGDAGNASDHACQPIETVDEVDDVRAGDEPEDRERNGECSQFHAVANHVQCRNGVSEDSERKTGEDLEQELVSRPQTDTVINDADGTEHGG